MNCEQYQAAIGADPGFAGGAEHLRDCVACAAYRREMQALDRQIALALALDVPELKMPELPQLDTQKVRGLPPRGRMTRSAWFAVAATVLLAAFIGVRFIGSGGSGYESLADEVLAHVKHEPLALRVTDVAVSDEHLDQVVHADVAALDHSAGLITFAETCPINGNEVPHLVIQGKRGPVTILLMPDEKVSGVIPLNDEDSHGVILPVGDGSIAIVGGRDEQLDEIQQQVVQSVMWRT